MILTPPAVDPAFYQSLVEKGVRLVTVDRRIEGLDIPSIITKDDSGIASLLKFLLDLGHRRIVHLAGPTSIWTGRVRREAFEKGAAAAGLSPEEATARAAGFYIEDGYRTTLALLDAGPAPDALIGANDPVAVGAIRALHERGLRVPEDVSVAGYGDTDLGRNFGLTTVRQFPDRMGSEAVRLLLSGHEPTAEDSIVIVPELVVRLSTAAPKGRVRAAR